MSGPRLRPAASLDEATAIPTPAGWRQLGELGPGDELFGADGLPCRVTAACERPAGADECFELRLCDGAVIACGEEQPWLVERVDGEPALISVADIARSLHSGEPPRYSIALAAPLEHRVKELPLEPYELGARLGSGMLEEARGVPGTYLLGDVIQRRELLMGLLDEGGGVSADGSVHFDTIHGRLARDVRELVASLGHRVMISSGGGCRASYRRVSFRTHEGVFGLRAPAEQLRERCRGEVLRRRWIVDVGAVGLRLMRSIEVDSSSHLHLVGEGLVVAPTRSSRLR